MTTKAQWRKWAIIQILYLHGPLTTKQLLEAIEQADWAVLPANGRLDSIHAVCKRASDQKPLPMIQRISTHPALWNLTVYGMHWAFDFLIDNPNITPAKSREEDAYK